MRRINTGRMAFELSDGLRFSMPDKCLTILQYKNPITLPFEPKDFPNVAPETTEPSSKFSFS